jgi:predicted hydrolase (HD superfamily)
MGEEARRQSKIGPRGFRLNRADAFALLNEYVKDQSLVRHCRAVETAMRPYARMLGEDEET